MNEVRKVVIVNLWRRLGLARPELSLLDEVKEARGITADELAMRRVTSWQQYIKDHHGLDMTAAMNLSHFNRAITNGAEDGTFALPKGPSGKVKLAPKTKPAPTNEVCYT